MKALSKHQMSALDKSMVSIGIDVPRMMEIAGLLCAIKAANLSTGKILCLCGHGNNGGDGLAAARHLLNWNLSVDIYIVKDDLNSNASHQLMILKNMGVTPIKKINWQDYNLIIDAMLGYNIVGAPRFPYDFIINEANDSKIPILSIDLPSGLDSSTGIAESPCIIAQTTLALSALKKGLVANSAKSYVGKIILGYMSVPKSINQKFGLQEYFSQELFQEHP